MKTNKKGEVIYSSFEELASAYKLKPVSKVTKDKEKLKGQQEKFKNRHLCKACNMPMTYIGANIMTCTNDNCKGIKITRENEDGTKSFSYITSYNLLDEKSELIAENIFSVKVD